MNSMTTEEKRVKRLEEQVTSLIGRLLGLEHKLGQVAEDNARDIQPFPRTPKDARLYRAQADGVISGAPGNTLGGGNAYLLQVIGGARYQMDPPQSVPIANDFGASIPDLTYLILSFTDGVYTLVAWDCFTEAPSAAPAPPG